MKMCVGSDRIISLKVEQHVPRFWKVQFPVRLTGNVSEIIHKVFVHILVDFEDKLTILSKRLNLVDTKTGFVCVDL